MNDREQIFASIRQALTGFETKTARPELDPSRWIAERRLGDDLWTSFASNLAGVRGFYMPNTSVLTTFLRERTMRVGYCDPALRAEVGEPLAENFEIRYTYERAAVDEIDFGITRAAGVIAETGTIVLKDTSTTNRLAALAPWAHIAVVDASQIYRTTADALADLGDDPNVIWVTGPSKTADVEGILIEGVHGPGEQICLRL